MEKKRSDKTEPLNDPQTEDLDLEFKFNSVDPFMKGSTEINNILTIVGEKRGTAAAFGVELRGLASSFVLTDYHDLRIRKFHKQEQLTKEEDKALHFYTILFKETLTHIGREGPIARKLVTSALEIPGKIALSQSVAFQAKSGDDDRFSGDFGDDKKS